LKNQIGKGDFALELMARKPRSRAVERHTARNRRDRRFL